MKTPLIPISFGELFNKISILEIKLQNVQDKNALKNVKIKYNQLRLIYNNNFLEHKNDKRLSADLRRINEKLWYLEDKIRDKERNKTFDKKFIELARSV